MVAGQFEGGVQQRVGRAGAGTAELGCVSGRGAGGCGGGVSAVQGAAPQRAVGAVHHRSHPGGGGPPSCGVAAHRPGAHAGVDPLARAAPCTACTAILTATVRFTGGRWQCAFQVIVAAKSRPAHARRSEHPVVGVDVGVKDLLVVATADGREVARVAAPKPLTRRNLTANGGPMAARAMLLCPHPERRPSHRLASSQRPGWPDSCVGPIPAVNPPATAALATAHDTVVVEQLAAKNMSRRGGRRKRGLNRALGDAAIGRIRTQLHYKTTWYGTTPQPPAARPVHLRLR